MKSICIYLDHGSPHRYSVTAASIHDIQMSPHLLNPEDKHDYVLANSACSGKCFEDLFSLDDFESLIYKKGGA